MLVVQRDRGAWRWDGAALEEVPRPLSGLPEGEAAVDPGDVPLGKAHRFLQDGQAGLPGG